MYHCIFLQHVLSTCIYIIYHIVPRWLTYHMLHQHNDERTHYCCSIREQNIVLLARYIQETFFLPVALACHTVVYTGTRPHQ